MKPALLVAVLALSCVSPSSPSPADEHFQIEVLQEAGEPPPNYLYTVLVSNTSGEVLTIDSVSVNPVGTSDIHFENARLTPLTNLKPAEQGEFRIWAEARSDGGSFDREGPAGVRVTVSYSVRGVAHVQTVVQKVIRPAARRRR